MVTRPRPRVCTLAYFRAVYSQLFRESSGSLSLSPTGAMGARYFNINRFFNPSPPPAAPITLPYTCARSTRVPLLQLLACTHMPERASRERFFSRALLHGVNRNFSRVIIDRARQRVHYICVSCLALRSCRAEAGVSRPGLSHYGRFRIQSFDLNDSCHSDKKKVNLLRRYESYDD